MRCIETGDEYVFTTGEADEADPLDDMSIPF